MRPSSMRHSTWLRPLFIAIFVVIGNCVEGKAYKGKEKNPDVLKEFRTFADSVIPEVVHSVSTGIKDPVHPYALLIDGPSVSRSEVDSKHHSLDAVRKDQAPNPARNAKSHNASAGHHNATVSTRKNTANQTKVAAQASVSDSSQKELEGSGSGDVSSGASGDVEESTQLLNSSKADGNVIVEALTKKEKPESFSSTMNPPVSDSSQNELEGSGSGDVSSGASGDAAESSTMNPPVSDSSQNELEGSDSGDVSSGASGDAAESTQLLNSSKADGNVIVEALAKKEKSESFSSTMNPPVSTLPAVEGSNKVPAATYNSTAYTNQIPINTAELATKAVTDLDNYPSAAQYYSNPQEAVMSAKKKVKKIKVTVKTNTTSPIANPDANNTKPTANEKTSTPSETKSDNVTDVGSDDDVDTYLDDEEEKPKKNVKTNAVKKKEEKQVAKSNEKKLKNNNQATKMSIKKKKPMKKMTHVRPSVYIYHATNATEPEPMEDPHTLGNLKSGAPSDPAPEDPATADPAPYVPAPAAPALHTPARPRENVCISSCSEKCAPSCTPQCCALETAEPPRKSPEPPLRERKIRWMERAHYEAGPNYPPPPIPGLTVRKIMPPKTCESPCLRSTCAPRCLPNCCNPPKPVPIVVGCSKQCNPKACVVGCPVHCCARYIKKSNLDHGDKKRLLKDGVDSNGFKSILV